MIVGAIGYEAMLLGQFFELMFVSTHRIEPEGLRAKLVDLGLSIQEQRGILDWIAWKRGSAPIRLCAATHHGEGSASFVRLGFDSRLFRELESLDEHKDLVDEFLTLGCRLWGVFPFYEGELSPEEEGALLHGLKVGPEQLREILPANNYARFLCPDAVELTQIQKWVLKDHPLATIQSLPEGGSLVIWDPSKEGLARFLSDEFFSTGMKRVRLY